MKCPNDGHELKKATYKELQVEECPQCNGDWLTFKEMDELEDEDWNQDQMKGTLIYESFPSKRKCPECNKQMKGFFYRLHDELQLEYCPDKHGIWLDAGEGDSVLHFIEVEHQANERQENEESEWIKHLYRLQDPNFFDRLLTYLPWVKGEEDPDKY